VIDQPLPSAIDAERAVIGSVLIDPDTAHDVIQILSPAAFSDERHALIWEHILAAIDKSEPLDGVLFQERLDRAGVLNRVGGLTYLGSLMGAVPGSSRALKYAELVRDKYLLRQLILTTSDIQAKALASASPAPEILDDAERAIFGVTEQRVRSGGVGMGEAVESLYARIFGSESVSVGLPTGYYELDSLTGGLQPAELIVIAGRPSMGKTAFGLNVAENMALDNGLPVLFFSLEMSTTSLAQRVLCSRARVDAHRLRRNMLGREELVRVMGIRHNLSQAQLIVDEASSLGILELRARARSVFRRTPCKAIFVDYLQLMRGPKSESRQVEVAEISRGLKALAKELSVPVVAMAQLNRGVEERGGNRPRMSDLRESGAIEQDADVVGLLHRDAYYQGAECTDEGEAELIIAKQRNGPVGTIRLRFSKEFTRFDNPSFG
jgi:replicative DNA helicase